MKVTGTATLNAPREAVWSALQDPAVLVRTIPGCTQLEATGDNAYRMTLTAGVASIKGTYLGEVRLGEHDAPNAYTLIASGQGAPGTVQAQARVMLSDDGGRTLLRYDADAVVGGMIGGVGQRVLAGVAKKTAGEFFSAIDRYLTDGPAALAAAPGGGEVPSPRAPGAGEPVAPLAVFRAPQPAVAAGGKEFIRGAAFGALVALAGVVVGALVGRRR